MMIIIIHAIGGCHVRVYNSISDYLFIDISSHARPALPLKLKRLLCSHSVSSIS